MTLKPDISVEPLDIERTVENRISLVDALVYQISGANPTVDRDALKSAGYKALQEAVETYNPEKGSLSGHSAKRVKWAIYEALRAENWIVKRSEEKYQRISLEQANLHHTDTPFKEVDKKELLEKLSQLLKILPKQQKLIIHEYFFLGKTFRDIAAEQKINLTKVWRTYQSVIKKLNLILKR